jgi:Na+-driven multidrug efflux pump
MVLLISVSAYAAHTVGIMIEAISFLPGFGFALAATTLVGQNLGARLPRRAKEYGNQALLIALAVMGFLGLTYWFFPGIWMRIFSNDPEVIEYGMLFCKFAAVIQIPLALTLILAGSLRGAGQTRWVMYSTLVGAWGIRVSIAYIFGWHFGLGIFFIWLAIPIDWTVRAIMLYLKYSSRKWSQGQ